MKFYSSLRSLLATNLMAIACGGISGCAGLNQSVSQSLGINSGARVPAPATGSYATPGNYAGGNLTGPQVQLPQTQTAVPGQAAPNTTSYFNPLAQPAGQIVNGINNAQNQFTQASEQARNSVVQTADSLNNRLQSASNRIDRFNQGVAQASAVMQEAIQAPPANQNQVLDVTTPAIGSGVANQNDPNDAWRKPNL